MKLIIHAGFHKTGTSALQAFCRLNRSQLAKQGILYPKAGTSNLRFPSAPSAEGGHRQFEIVIASPTNKTAQGRLKSIIDEVGTYQDIQTVLISSETFSTPKMVLSNKALSVLQEYFSEIKILIYMRRQDDWADSFYREVLCWSRKREESSFQVFMQKFLPEWLDYATRLNKWAVIFGRENMIVKSFDDRKNKNVIVDVLSELGLSELPDNEYVFPVDINPSIPADLVPLMLEINKLNLDMVQRSSITHRIYNELEKSSYRVTRKPLVTPILAASYADSYREMNQQLCSQYGIEDCEYLCFGFNKPVDSKETSLPAELVEEIKQLAKEMARKPARSGDDHHGRNDLGRVGVSCLLKEVPLQVKIFVNYHLELGVSKIRLYFDDPEDPMADYDYGTDQVEVIRCTADFWREKFGGDPETNDDKLYTCHQDGLNYLNKQEDIDWVINLDADELIYVDSSTDLRKFMSDVSKGIDQLRICPLENIFVSEQDMELFSARYFKVPKLNMFNRSFANRKGLKAKLLSGIFYLIKLFSKLRLIRSLLLSYSNIMGMYLPWSIADAELYQENMPMLSKFMRNGFLGHRQGRTFTRHGIELDRMSSHVPKSSRKTLNTQKFCNKIFVLHYDAASYAAWHLKWHRRAFGDTTAIEIGDDRQKQQDMFIEAHQQGEDAVREFFYGLFRFPQSAISKFEKAGLVAKINNPHLLKVLYELKE